MNKQSFTSGFAVVIFACLEIHAAGQSAGAFQLKKRSAFSDGGTGHDPFWPIGWVKPDASATAPAAVKEVEFSTEGFVLTSILLGQPALAVINGKEYAEGETISYETGGQKIGIQLAAVQDGFVILRYHDKNYTVQMRRKGEEGKAAIAKTDEMQLALPLR